MNIGGKSIAKVIVITKDEHDLIADFIKYYSHLVGSNNVVVVDNGSDESDARVQDVYRDHIAAGGVVHVDKKPFVDAVRFMSDHMHLLRNTCEFIMPLETDEFLFMLGKTKICCHEDLAAVLSAVPEDVSVIRYGEFYGSAVDPADAGYVNGAYTRPARQITRFFNQGWDKIIVRASMFVSMTQWCHHAIVLGGKKVTSEDLGLLHFHDTGRRRLIEKSIPVVRSYGYLELSDTTNTLDDQLAMIAPLMDAPIACGHKVNYLGRHLRRKATLCAFRRRLGRLPHSPEELEQYASDPFPDNALRKAILNGELNGNTSNTSLSWNELLYHEGRMQGDIWVRQVADFFLEELP